MTNSPLFNPVFYRTYSRKTETGRESYDDMVARTMKGLKKVGKLTQGQLDLVRNHLKSQKAVCSGRWMWVGGTEWRENPENIPGGYNCVSRRIQSFADMAILMDLAMQGCGTGAVLEDVCIDKLPKITTKLNVTVLDDLGTSEAKFEKTDCNSMITQTNYHINILVGDSRQGWTSAYHKLLDLSTSTPQGCVVNVTISLGRVRPKGTPLKGFGGVANPEKLPGLFTRMADILNKAVGRKLKPTEVCLLIDEAAKVVVAGNIRRSAGMRQFSSGDDDAAIAKDNLWLQDFDGSWTIDSERDAYRMANHTRVFHHKPSLQECIDSVTKQYYSGEGAIMWAGEAVARANADLLKTTEDKKRFLADYSKGKGRDHLVQYIASRSGVYNKPELDHRINRYGVNPCQPWDTLVCTKQGHFLIKDLVGRKVEVWNGLNWVKIDNFRVTGENQPLLKITFEDGSYLEATPYHKLILEDKTRVECQDLVPHQRLSVHNQYTHGDIVDKSAYLKGFLLGDGSVLNRKNRPKDSVLCQIFGEKVKAIPRLLNSLISIPLDTDLSGHNITDPGICKSESHYYYFQGLNARQSTLKAYADSHEKYIPWEIFQYDKQSKLEFIAGYLDADGNASVQNNSVCYRVSSVAEAKLRQIQTLLKTVGIYSSIRKEYEERIASRGHKEQALWTLHVYHNDSVKLANMVTFSRLESFAEYPLSKINYRKHNVIKSIEDAGIASKVYCCTEPENHAFSLSIGLNTAQCSEILGNDFFCNLSSVHLNQLNPFDYAEHKQAFRAAALSAVVLLHDQFLDDRFQKSRDLDPIIGVSFTGLFDFFVNAFGVKWLKWCIDGRPDTEYGKVCKGVEAEYLREWRQIVEETVQDYCTKNGLKVPNRCTTVKPEGTQSCLTGASSGWHPPKASRYIRRITFGKNDPVALACIDYGYNVVPSQSDKDEDGKLLDDPFSPLCTEWLVEIPIEKSWANLEGVDNLDISQMPALAQFDLWMQCQKYYAGHTVSATIELREDEIVPLATRIHKAIENDEGYVGVALLARFDSHQTFPRLPFEPISKVTYDRLKHGVLERRKSDNFQELLAKYDKGVQEFEGPSGCDSDFCEGKELKNINKITFPSV